MSGNHQAGRLLRGGEDGMTWADRGRTCKGPWAGESGLSAQASRIPNSYVRSDQVPIGTIETGRAKCNSWTKEQSHQPT